MENLSVSKIHKLTKTTKPLNEFINDEKTLFEAKKKDGRSAKVLQGMNFETFLNKRYQKHLGIIDENQSADGKILKSVASLVNKPAVQSVVNTVQQTIDKSKSQTTPGTVDNTIPKSTVKKTILGMKPIVFYSVTGSVLLITGILIIKMIKKRSK